MKIIEAFIKPFKWRKSRMRYWKRVCMDDRHGSQRIRTPERE